MILLNTPLKLKKEYINKNNKKTYKSNNYKIFKNKTIIFKRKLQKCENAYKNLKKIL